MALTYATTLSAGLDLPLKKGFTLYPHTKERVPLDINVDDIKTPEGYFLGILPKSGLTFKHGVQAFPHDIDLKNLYPNEKELAATLISYSNEPYTFEDGQSVAQLVALKEEKPVLVPLQVFSEVIIPPGEYRSALTQRVVLEPDQCAIVYPAGTNLVDGIVAKFGLVDADFEDPISVCLYNETSHPITINENTNVAWAAIHKFVHLEDFPVIEKERGRNGFGSTGK